MAKMTEECHCQPQNMANEKILVFIDLKSFLFMLFSDDILQVGINTIYLLGVRKVNR